MILFTLEGGKTIKNNQNGMSWLAVLARLAGLAGLGWLGWAGLAWLVGLAGLGWLGLLTELAGGWSLGPAGASWDCQAGLAGWTQGGLGQFTIRELSGNYPGFGMAWLVMAGWAGLAGCWLGGPRVAWADFTIRELSGIWDGLAGHGWAGLA